MEVRLAPTAQLSIAELRRIRLVCDLAFAGDDPDDAFTDDDMQHALGGLHAIALEDGVIVAHGSVVARELHAGTHRLRTGYLEGVAVVPDRQRRGLGTAVVRPLTEHVRERFELGALGTSAFSFYERLGWERWRGPTSVRTRDGERRTPDEDGFVMVLRTPHTPPGLDPEAPISCDWRSGDVW